MRKQPERQRFSPEVHRTAKSIRQTAIAPAAVPELVAAIHDEIAQRGPMTFARFMECALYDRVHGYYSSGRAEIGRRGDYITNVSVGAVFGELLAAQFAEVWEIMGRPAPFTIAEQGAHFGQLAADVLHALRAQHGDCFAATAYRIVEPFAALRQKQHTVLREFETEWFDSLDELPCFCGVHFSNELLDAMPVHLLRRDSAGEWQERYVVNSRDGFGFESGALSSPRLRETVESLGDLPKPFDVEVSLAAVDWIRTLAGRLTRGAVLVIDYGYSREQSIEPHRREGTLQVRARHRVLSSPFLSIGAADITAHVNWTAVCEAAAGCGLRVLGVGDQHHFLTGVMTTLWRDEFARANPAKRRRLQTLLQPELLGRAFQFFVAGRDLPSRPGIAGLRYARR